MRLILKQFSYFLEKYWKLKALTFWILNILPNTILYYLQHNITARSVKPISSIDSDWNFIFEKIQENKDEKNISLIEFGAGRNLAQNIYLALKIDGLSQTVVDLNRMINEKLIFTAYEEICLLVGKEKKINTKDISYLLSELKINYLSPIDIAKYKPNIKFNFCVSKDTIEHIPTFDIIKILINIRKILVKDGFLISCVDYSDHYSHTNKYLSKLNFLKYSNLFWFLLNPPNHFQNRIRHIDFKKILESNKFQTVEEKITSNNNLDVVPANRFKKYSEKDLLIVRSQIISKMI